MKLIYLFFVNYWKNKMRILFRNTIANLSRNIITIAACHNDKVRACILNVSHIFH